MSSSAEVTSVAENDDNFAVIKQELEQDAHIRTEIEQAAQQLDASAQISSLSSSMLLSPTDKLKQMQSELLNTFKPRFQEMKKYPYRYHHIWNRHLQSHLFAHLLIGFMVERRLVTYAEVIELLDLAAELVDIEDYLHACISLCNELARLSMTAVIHAEYGQPQEILTFITELFVQFQGLNLKNDSLRRRYDSMKYDVKKVEEVVYNLRLRKFI